MAGKTAVTEPLTCGGVVEGVVPQQQVEVFADAVLIGVSCALRQVPHTYQSLSCLHLHWWTHMTCMWQSALPEPHLMSCL